MTCTLVAPVVDHRNSADVGAFQRTGFAGPEKRAICTPRAVSGGVLVLDVVADAGAVVLVAGAAVVVVVASVVDGGCVVVGVEGSSSLLEQAASARAARMRPTSMRI